MKTLLLIFSAIFLSIGSASAAQTHHYLFFVHGIGGDETTFGSMPEALVHHMDQAKLDLEVKHKAFRFIYRTKNQFMDGNDFAVDLGEFIHENLKNRMQPGDKISLISHSQGGIVSLIWYFRAYTHSKSYTMGPRPFGENPDDKINYHSEYVPYMDAIVSIGTPYWGSKLASLLSKDSWAIKLAADEFFPTLGDRQLQEMSLGSQTITDFRTNVTQIPQALLNEMKQKIRPLNIAGSADIVNILKDKTYGASKYLKMFKSLAFGSQYYESDIAVPVPSARFDSIYTVDSNEDYAPGATTRITQTKVTEFAPLVILNTLHTSVGKDIPGMVEVPAACIDSISCNHPAFKYVVAHMIGGTKLPAYGPGVPSAFLGGFMTSFRIKFPKNTNAKNQAVRIQLIWPKPNEGFDVNFGESKEFMDMTEYFSVKDPTVLFRSEMGHIKYKNYQSETYRQIREKGVEATFLIEAKGFRPRYVETILRPTYSTFVEVSLAPN